MSAESNQPSTTVQPARLRLRATTPASYRWWRHVLLIAVFTLLGLLFTLAQIDHVSVGGWIFFAASLVLLNFGEYASHRWSMHVLRWPRAVYHRHVIEHHAFFTNDRMSIDGIEDLRWVLFPPWALPLLVVTVLPVFLVLLLFAPVGWAWLYLLAVVLYYGIYEALHALAHLPDDDPVARYELVQTLTRHHRIHHDPALMDRWNFNFVVPLFDWLFGTTYRVGHTDPAYESLP